MGPRKRFHIVLQIVGFLIASVGILFFCQYLSHTLNTAFETEGFEVAPALDGRCATILGQTKCALGTELPDKSFNRTIFYCPTEYDAQLIIDPSSYCMLNDNDNVCISSMTFGNNYYTCYRRPPQMKFDYTFGVWQKKDPIMDDDTAPMDIAPNIDFVCAAYAGNTVNVIQQLMSTIAVRNAVNNIIVSTLEYSRKIQQFKNLYCTPATLTNSNITEICSRFETSKQFFSSLVTTPIVNGISLSNISVTTYYSVSSLSNVSTNIYVSFKGFNCDTNLVNKYTVSTYIISD